MSSVNKNTSSRKKYLFFYLTLVYIISFLIWWTYLLYSKTESFYDHKIDIELWKNDSFEDSSIHQNIITKYQREKIMIITEGAVFLVILLLLIYRVKKAVEQEIVFSRQQQNFILSITHELKSPLSSIKLMTQTLGKHQLKEEQKNKLLNNTLSEVDRLQNLVENVLLAAKIDNDSYGFAKTNIDISELLETILLRYKVAQGVAISYEIEKNISIEADISAMSSLIINLIENAYKYSSDKKPIEVALSQQQSKIIFIVKDQGIGISEEDKLKVFDKFYRIGNEETRATKGTGLGLYIVKELVRFHNGTIKIKNNKPNGSIFELIFEV